MKIQVPMERDTLCAYCNGVFSAQSGGPLWNSRLNADDPDVAVIPTRGMLIEGWLLVVPSDHVLSTMSMPSERRRKYWDAVARARDLVERAYGPATLFEHGAFTPDSVVGCGVDHAHVHVAPLQFDIVAAARVHPAGRSLTWRRIADVQSQVDLGEPYLFAQTPTDGCWLGTGSIPSQFFRRVIADTLGPDVVFDWRANDGMELVQSTIDRIAPTSMSGLSPHASFAEMRV